MRMKYHANVAGSIVTVHGAIVAGGLCVTPENVILNQLLDTVHDSASTTCQASCALARVSNSVLRPSLPHNGHMSGVSAKCSRLRRCATLAIRGWGAALLCTLPWASADKRAIIGSQASDIIAGSDALQPRMTCTGTSLSSRTCSFQDLLVDTATQVGHVYGISAAQLQALQPDAGQAWLTMDKCDLQYEDCHVPVSAAVSSLLIHLLRQDCEHNLVVIHA